MVTVKVMWRNKATGIGFAASAACGILLFGCASHPKDVTLTTPAETIQPAQTKAVPTTAAPTTAAPTPAAPTPAAPKISVRAVKSADGSIDGEIVGTLTTESKFAQLQIGMTRTQVESLIGVPTSTDSRLTGKYYQPFYLGGDTQRTEAFYINEGHLTFSNILPDKAADTLIRITINPNATGNRQYADTYP